MANPTQHLSSFSNEDMNSNNPNLVLGCSIFRGVISVFILVLAKFLVCDTDFLSVSAQTIGQPHNLIAISTYELSRMIISPIFLHFRWDSKRLIGVTLILTFILHLTFELLNMNDMYEIEASSGMLSYLYTKDSSSYIGPFLLVLIIPSTMCFQGLVYTKLHSQLFTLLCIHITLYINLNANGPEILYTFILFHITILIGNLSWDRILEIDDPFENIV